MAATDTIPGTIRFLKQDQTGSTKVLIDGLRSERLDLAVAGDVYFNLETGRNDVLSAGDQKRTMTEIFYENEILICQINADTLAEAIAYDTAGDQLISVVFTDLNTKRKWASILTTADTNLTADPTSVVGTYVTYYSFTVPTKTSMQLYDVCGSQASENA